MVPQCGPAPCGLQRNDDFRSGPQLGPNREPNGPRPVLRRQSSGPSFGSETHRSRCRPVLRCRKRSQTGPDVEQKLRIEAGGEGRNRFRCRPVLRRRHSGPKFRSPFRVQKASFALQTGERSRQTEPNGPRRGAKVANRGRGVNSERRGGGGRGPDAGAPNSPPDSASQLLLYVWARLARNFATEHRSAVKTILFGSETGT